MKHFNQKSRGLPQCFLFNLRNLLHYFLFGMLYWESKKLSDTDCDLWNMAQSWKIVHYQISGKCFQISQTWVNDPCIGWRYQKNHPVGRWLQGKLLRSLGMINFFFGWKSTPLCDFIFSHFVWGPRITPLITGFLGPPCRNDIKFRMIQPCGFW